MASNFFGQVFRITTFGESHGKGIGVVIDGCPAGLQISQEEIDCELDKRRPGKTPFTSPRKEKDRCSLLSGVFQGFTTGAPVAIWVENSDIDSKPYEAMQSFYRPGHAQFSYLQKYGIFDPRGGGRASARETVARVAAGAIAKKFLARFDIHCKAFLQKIGDCQTAEMAFDQLFHESPIFCPDPLIEKEMIDLLEKIQQEGDSIGGIVGCRAKIPAGLGDPVYGKLEAHLAFAMLSLPATKGFEIGQGFLAAEQKGSEHNDLFDVDEKGDLFFRTNLAGGILGGISTGQELSFQVAFKPTSSIKKEQEVITFTKEKRKVRLYDQGRHDPCVAIRAVPVVEAMTAIVLADLVLMQRLSRI